jgi:hypothetical protein
MAPSRAHPVVTVIPHRVDARDVVAIGATGRW